jgi:hypothetical protein
MAPQNEFFNNIGALLTLASSPIKAKNGVLSVRFQALVCLARCVSPKLSALPSFPYFLRALNGRPDGKLGLHTKDKASNLKMGLGRPLTRLFVSSCMGSAH